MEGEGVELHAFLSTALEEGGWSASRPIRFSGGGGATDTEYTEGSVGPTVTLDVMNTGKISAPSGFQTQTALWGTGQEADRKMPCGVG